MGDPSYNPSVVTTVPQNEMRPSEQIRESKLLSDRSDHDDRIVLWQNQVFPTVEGPEGTIQHLCVSCLDALSLLIERYENEKNEINSLRRCHGTLQFWAHQHGVHNGTLEATLQRSTNIRQAIIELILPLCKTLLQGEHLLAISL